MTRLAVSEVRSLLSSYMQRCKDGATAPEIIVAFRSAHGASVAKASRELEDMALTKLISEAGNRIPSSAPGQPDLFAGYSIPDAIVIPFAGGEKRNIHKPTAKATMTEVEAWIEHHEKPRVVTPVKVVEMRRMIEAIRPFAASDITTVEDALRASKAQEERKTA